MSLKTWREDSDESIRSCCIPSSGRKHKVTSAVIALVQRLALCDKFVKGGNRRMHDAKKCFPTTICLPKFETVYFYAGADLKWAHFKCKALALYQIGVLSTGQTYSQSTELVYIQQQIARSQGDNTEWYRSIQMMHTYTPTRLCLLH